MENKRGVAECLEGFAALNVDRDPERSARLYGLAETIRAAAHLPLFPIERARYDRTKAAAHGALGAETFLAAWSVGQEMSLDQALAQVT